VDALLLVAAVVEVTAMESPAVMVELVAELLVLQVPQQLTQHVLEQQILVAVAVDPVLVASELVHLRVAMVVLVLLLFVM
jgi:hypothetical protein